MKVPYTLEDFYACSIVQFNRDHETEFENWKDVQCSFYGELATSEKELYQNYLDWVETRKSKLMKVLA